ncbi:MAG: zinc ribbon domain-containing protein [Oscillospiraceae bacterium]
MFWRCPKCGHENDINTNKCTQCGTVVIFSNSQEKSKSKGLNQGIRIFIGIFSIFIVTTILTIMILKFNDDSNILVDDSINHDTNTTTASNIESMTTTNTTTTIEETTPTEPTSTTMDTFEEITTEENIIETTIITTTVSTTVPTVTSTITTEPMTSIVETTTETNPPVNIDGNSYSSNFTQYYNDSFNYSISYPDNFYSVYSSSDGCTLTNNFADIKTYSYINDFGETVESSYQNAVANINADISYKLVKSNFYIISWIENGNVLYRKVYITDDRCVCLEFEYSVDYKPIYDSMIETIVPTFKVR